MKPLPKEYRGIVLLSRIGDTALCLNIKNEGNWFAGYEVHQVTIAPAVTIKGVFYPERERYASSSEFGIRAWAYPNMTTVFKHHPEFAEKLPEILENLGNTQFNACNKAKVFDELYVLQNAHK